MNPSFRQQIPGEAEALPALMAAARAFLDQHDIPHPAAFRVELAIEELVTNIVKYGYAGAPDPRPIAVEVALQPAVIRLRIEDQGRAFDPRTAPAPDLEAPIERRAVGGLGLHLVRSMAARLDYRREGSANILEVDIARR